MTEKFFLNFGFGRRLRVDLPVALNPQKLYKSKSLVNTFKASKTTHRVPNDNYSCQTPNLFNNAGHVPGMISRNECINDTNHINEHPPI